MRFLSPIKCELDQGGMLGYQWLGSAQASCFGVCELGCDAIVCCKKSQPFLYSHTPELVHPATRKLSPAQCFEQFLGNLMSNVLHCHACSIAWPLGSSSGLFDGSQVWLGRPLIQRNSYGKFDPRITSFLAYVDLRS